LSISQRLRWVLPRAAIGLTAGATLAAGLVIAPAAQASVSLFTGPSAATVWTPLTYTLRTDNATETFVLQANGSQVASFGSAQCSGVGSASCTLTATWSPPSTGSFSVLAVGNAGSQSTTLPLTVSSAPTTTAVQVTNVAQVGRPTTVTVTVQSQAPSTLLPLGNANFILNGAQVASVGLQRGSSTSQAVATYSWTPNSTGTFTWSASYSPASGSNANASQTTTSDSVQVTQTGTIVSLVLPPAFNVNTPATLTAQVNTSPSAGTVVFSVNGQAITAPQQVNAQGTTATTWTPQSTGNVNITAQWFGANNQNANTTQTVVVGAAVQRDVITLTQPGYGNWVAGQTYSLAPGSSTTFAASTLSGAAATLSTNGGCTASGLTLVTPATSATCALTAVSPGGNGYAGATQSYTVTVSGGSTVQDADLSWPNNRRIAKGRAVTLAAPGESVTNAGQPVSFRITTAAGRRACSLQYPANGSVVLRKRTAGRCTVVASAPAAGAFGPYRDSRTYR
jgi:hypothetical protein